MRRCQRRQNAEHPKTRTTTPPPQVDGDYDGLDENNGDNYPYDDNDSDYGVNEHDGLVDVASNSISQCPVENGVIRTNWGSVSAGPLMAGEYFSIYTLYPQKFKAQIFTSGRYLIENDCKLSMQLGIAAGLVQQNVPTRELLMLSKSTRTHRLTRQPLSIDNRFAATLAGNLAEVALLQGPMSRAISVGSSGGWNSTAVPHWYFLLRREHTEMTDAQIRGGIDGLVLAKHIAEWRQQASELRLSQVLDWYYSLTGAFAPEMRACNRRELFTKHIPITELQAQSHAFSTVLDQEMQLKVTLSNKAIKDFADAASDKLVTYVCTHTNMFRTIDFVGGYYNRFDFHFS